MVDGFSLSTGLVVDRADGQGVDLAALSYAEALVAAASGEASLPLGTPWGAVETAANAVVAADDGRSAEPQPGWPTTPARGRHGDQACRIAAPAPALRPAARSSRRSGRRCGQS